MRATFIDGNSIAHWRFHAGAQIQDEQGREIGMLRSVRAWLEQFVADWQPERTVIVFDGPNNWRNLLYHSYKMHRPPTDPVLKTQLEALPVFLCLPDAPRVDVLKVDGFEGDDVLAGLVAQLGPDDQAIVVSRDKDLCQLIDERVRCLDPMGGALIDEKAVVAKFGVPPSRLRDVLAICGDASDGVPGVPGWGAKNAAKAVNATANFWEIRERCKKRDLGGISERLQIILADHADLVRDYDLVGLRVPPEMQRTGERLS